MKKLTFLILTLLFFSLNAFCQFSAIMKNVKSGNEIRYTLYSDNEQYRYEFEADGTEGIVIVNPKENKTFILMPDKKFVHKTTCDSRMSRMNDPVQSYAYFKKHASEKNIGNETINGYKCQHNELYRSDKKVFSAWFSDELNFPVKIITHYTDDTYMELHDIKKWEVDDSYFTLPEGYTEVDEKLRPVIPEPKAPEKWETVNGSIPYKGTVKRGTILKIKIDESVYHKLVVSNKTDSPGKFTWHLYRNGTELSDNEQGPVKYRTKRLMSGEKKSFTYDWKRDDEIRIKVYEGTLNFEIRPE